MKKKSKKAKATKKKTVRKKVVRKKAQKGVVARSKKKGTRKAMKRGKASGAVAVKKPVINGTLVGHVTHYFPHVNAAVVKIEKGEIAVGDNLYFKGHTTDFKQSVGSIQMDRTPIQKAGVGDEVGVEVQSRVREHDEVYRLR